MNIVHILRQIRYFKAALNTVISIDVRKKLEQQSQFIKINLESDTANQEQKVTP